MRDTWVNGWSLFIYMSASSGESDYSLQACSDLTLVTVCKQSISLVDPLRHKYKHSLHLRVC